MSSELRSGKGKEREGDRDGESTNKSALEPLNNVLEQLLTGGYLSKPLDPSSWDEREASKIERCLSTMLARLASSQQDLARLMDKHRGLASDFDRLEQAHSRSSQTLEASEHEREQAKAKALSATKELAAEHARHTLAKDEVQKARLALASVKTLAQHESKRRDNEVASVLARWQKISSASTSGTSIHAAAIIVNSHETISKNSSTLVARNNGRQTPSEVTLLEESLNHIHEERHNLQEENVHLREVIGDVFNEVKATLVSLNVEVPSLEDDLSDPLTHNIAPHLSLSPDDMTAHLSRLLMALRDATQSALHDTENGVKALLEESATQSDARIKELEESLAHMQQELDAARLDNEAKEKTLQVREADVQLELTALEREVKTLRHEGKEAKQTIKELSVKLKQMEENEKKQKLVNVEKEEQSRKRSAATVADSDEPAMKRPKVLDTSSAVADSPPATGHTRAKSGPVRQSVTSAALQNILATSADTPPARSSVLSSKAPNTHRSTRSTVSADNKEADSSSAASAKVARESKRPDASKDAAVVAPSSAALAAKDRIQRAVEAAKARNSSSSNSTLENVTRRRR